MLQNCAPIVLHMIDNLVQDLIGEFRVVADDGDAKNGAAPQVEVVYLGGRNVELVTQMREEALDHMPLVFERVGLIDRKMKRQNTNMHDDTPDSWYRRGGDQGRPRKVRI